MKKKLRRKLKDYFQIGNYIYANQQGYIAVVVPPKVYPKPELVSSDFQTLYTRYGVDYAFNYLNQIAAYKKSKR